MAENEKDEHRGKRILLRTFGCQMNESDSEVLSGVLAQAGYALVPEENQADILIVNTCAVRASAEHKVFSKLGEWSLLKKANPRLALVVVGCMAQNHQRDLLRRVPALDIVCGPQNIRKMPELIERVLAEREALLEVEDTGEFSLKAVPVARSDPFKAFVTIMRGCDKTCTYCIVPFTRGREISRDPEEILEEVRELARRGYKEVTLLGQNVNSYGKGLAGPSVDCAELLERVNGVEGIRRVRFVTSHPMDISDRLIDAIGSLPKVCEYLHFPLQSGSDGVLKRMKRSYTRARYMEIVSKIRVRKPGIALSADVIVGFPGETLEDFQQTVDAVREIQFDVTFVFKYSAREGTPAAKLVDDVPRQEKERRHWELLNLVNEITLQRNRAYIGKTVEVLVEGPSSGNPSRWAGRTRENKLAIFSPTHGKPGDIISLAVHDATAQTLRCD